jgi:hypothetical protein
MGRLKKALIPALVLSSGGALVAKAETVKSMLAAQIRTQGFACDKPLKAKRDAKLSRPNHAVWVLKCENATYRIGRYPNMAAKVEKLDGRGASKSCARLAASVAPMCGQTSTGIGSGWR